MYKFISGLLLSWCGFWSISFFPLDKSWNIIWCDFFILQIIKIEKVRKYYWPKPLFFWFPGHFQHHNIDWSCDIKFEISGHSNLSFNICKYQPLDLMDGSPPLRIFVDQEAWLAAVLSPSQIPLHHRWWSQWNMGLYVIKAVGQM